MDRTIFILDKVWPPKHSFVDGVICSDLFKKNVKPIIFTEKETNQCAKVFRYRGIPVIVGLPRRRGLRRIVRFLYIFYYVFLLKIKFRTGLSKTIFVRNDPVALLSCVVLKLIGIFSDVVYQNSFPHERVKGILGFLTAKSFSILLPFCRSVYVVSRNAKKRINEYSTSQNVKIVPLLVQGDMICPHFLLPRKIGNLLHLVYVGSLHPSRKIEIVLKGLYLAYCAHLPFKCSFYGGNEKDLNRLSSLDIVREMIDSEFLYFRGRIDRNLLLSEMKAYDVGISLIPPDPIFIESSPTKIGEYLGAGLYVLASRGILFQEEVVEASGCGRLVTFDPSEIAAAIEHLCKNLSEIRKISIRAVEFVSSELTYDLLLNDLIRDFV